jgi:formylmethanofuran dehydrogenase subunit E
MSMRITSKKKRLLESAVEFHGHLGPYLILGLRMGLSAVRILKPKRLHELHATVWTKKSPPESCVIDGIQMSSGCTLGKGNIRVLTSRPTKAIFRKGKRTLVLEPTANTSKLLSNVAGQTPGKIKEIATALYRLPDHELLQNH